MIPLPDPLVCADGTRVIDAVLWRGKRRPELLAAFAREVYGRTPLVRLEGMSFETTSVRPDALGGAATRKEIMVRFAPGTAGLVLRLLLYVPNAGGAGKGGLRPSHPAFLGLNFFGNHTVDSDPGIALASDAARGADASKWQLEAVISRGYASATVYCGDLCPDRPNGLQEGVVGWLETPGTSDRAPDSWGAIGAWAWGLSRALDYLETNPDFDASRVAVHGHSRLGKAALWAGAQDERFAMVVSNDSGCGGASLSRHIHGETIAQINKAFPHWFCRNFLRYDNNEAALPVDQHELLALLAPRPLYVASAEDDDWADPQGEFLAAQAAGPVYRLFGLEDLGATEMPPVNHPVGSALRYHIRTGPHDMTACDWSRYLDFADSHLSTRPGCHP
jgi:hypothetical protein